MTFIDVLILATVVLCGALGVLSGFAVQLAGILSLAVGVGASIFLGPMAAEAMGRWIQNESLAPMLAYLGVFCVASMAVRILVTVFGHFLKKWKLEKMDRALGAVLGVAKGLAICAVVVVILGRYGTTETRRSVNDSLLGGKVIWIADLVMGKARDEGWKDKAVEAGEKLKEAAEKAKATAGKQAYERRLKNAE